MLIDLSGVKSPCCFQHLFFTETVDFDEGDWVRGPKFGVRFTARTDTAHDETFAAHFDHPPLPRGF